MTLAQLLLALPLFVMVFLTFVVLITLARKRFKAAQAGTLDTTFYSVYRGDAEPDDIRQVSRNLTNLFETPVLFYAGVILALTLNVQSFLLVAFAWLYVVLRCFHSYIHCTNNHVKKRLKIFVRSVFALMFFWGILLVQLLLQFFNSAALIN
ncbi:MAPEG family protein [Pleionea sp. CnH1-48]|uniref:MAPEG family protein n=1 Tax=Pleionea sp. CnH1-48 TaxID=2954494 RepID=UPI0020984FF6|nr:MAPEG family protein [Pleionea sp. CnH1-48]MCO7223128.1 MAPEG family protein [Pleionea sp. CnH1-48]